MNGRSGTPKIWRYQMGECRHYLYLLEQIRGGKGENGEERFGLVQPRLWLQTDREKVCYEFLKWCVGWLLYTTEDAEGAR